MKMPEIKKIQTDIVHRCFPNLASIIDAPEYHRRRLQVSVSGIDFIFTLAMGCTCYSVGLQFTPIVLFSACVLSLVAFLMLRLGREAAVWLGLVMLCAMVSVWFCIWETGFWQGGVLAWLSIGPVAAKLLYKKAALPLLWANTIFAFILFLMWHFNMPLPNRLTSEATAMFSIVNGIALMFVIFWFANEITENRATAYRDLKKSKEELAAAMLLLENTKSQLVQAEKMAALGELTAGIAHEIQNPLNFVNNFSELSVDLVQELQQELRNSKWITEGEIMLKDKAYIDEILNDLTTNQTKIRHHGNRASSIVKSMLLHSQASTGVKKMTHINQLIEENLLLSYQDWRVKDEAFNTDFKIVFDENLPKINIVSQDIGRVLLNLFNNAFYAVNKCKVDSTIAQQSPNLPPYSPIITVTTQSVISPLGINGIMISVTDNGTGMSKSVKDKIFQPFFTTKPAGEGTGLGLSLSYDIVIKGHGGKLEVNSNEGKGSEFVISLPM